MEANQQDAAQDAPSQLDKPPAYKDTTKRMGAVAAAPRRTPRAGAAVAAARIKSVRKAEAKAGLDSDVASTSSDSNASGASTSSSDDDLALEDEAADQGAAKPVAKRARRGPGQPAARATKAAEPKPKPPKAPGRKKAAAAAASNAAGPGPGPGSAAAAAEAPAGGGAPRRGGRSGARPPGLQPPNEDELLGLFKMFTEGASQHITKEQMTRIADQLSIQTLDADLVDNMFAFAAEEVGSKGVITMTEFRRLCDSLFGQN